MLVQKHGPANYKRAEVISAFVATLARQRDDVIEFRKKILKSRFLKLDQVEPWIRSHAELPTTKLTVSPSEDVRLTERGIEPARIDLNKARRVEFCCDKLMFATTLAYVSA